MLVPEFWSANGEVRRWRHFKNYVIDYDFVLMKRSCPAVCVATHRKSNIFYNFISPAFMARTVSARFSMHTQHTPRANISVYDDRRLFDCVLTLALAFNFKLKLTHIVCDLFRSISSVNISKECYLCFTSIFRGFDSNFRSLRAREIIVPFYGNRCAHRN